MSLLNNLSINMKFKKSYNFIKKRIKHLNRDLRDFEEKLHLINNQADDEINWMLMSECCELDTDCQFSIHITNGKLKSLKPLNPDQIEKKEELQKTFASSVDKFHTLSSELHNHELYTQLAPIKIIEIL